MSQDERRSIDSVLRTPSKRRSSPRRDPMMSGSPYASLLSRKTVRSRSSPSDIIPPTPSPQTQNEKTTNRPLSTPGKNGAKRNISGNTPISSAPLRTRSPVRSISIPAFANWLEKTVVVEFGGWEALERSKQITDGNTVLKASHVGNAQAWSLVSKSMAKAQYGRARYSFIDQAMKAVGASPSDTVVDIGSGVGTVVFQIAATIGCKEVIGIELCMGRHEAALRFKPHFDTFLTSLRRSPSSVKLLQGDFREPSHFALCKTADIIFVNNAEAVFGARSVLSGSFTLDWHVARAACAMRIGGRLVCFESLVDLEQGQLKDCFLREDHLSEKGATSWTETSGKRTKFVSYRKLTDSWVCKHCKAENVLLRASRNTWGETIQDACEMCSSDPNGMKRSYPTRSKRMRLDGN